LLRGVLCQYSGPVFGRRIIHPRLQVELAAADGGAEFGKRERPGDGEQCDALNQGCPAMLQKHDGFEKPTNTTKLGTDPFRNRPVSDPFPAGLCRVCFFMPYLVAMPKPASQPFFIPQPSNP